MPSDSYRVGPIRVPSLVLIAQVVFFLERDKQTDRQTDRQTDATASVGNNSIEVSLYEPIVSVYV